jgi:hypothetical protein
VSDGLTGRFSTTSLPPSIEALAILDTSSIYYVNPNDPGEYMFIGFPEYGWAAGDDALAMARMRVLERYDRWLAGLQRLLRKPTPDVQRRIDEADELVRGWLERSRGNDHSVPATVQEAKVIFSARIQALRDLVDLAAGGPDAKASFRVIPDTVSLIRNRELASYWRAVGSDTSGPATPARRGVRRGQVGLGGQPCWPRAMVIRSLRSGATPARAHPAKGG